MKMDFNGAPTVRNNSSTAFNAIIAGTTTHTRHAPTHHHFEYPLVWIRCDTRELSQSPLGYNQRRLWSIYDADYLDPTADTLDAKLNKHMQSMQFQQPVTHIQLLTMPRYLGRPFKPISLYLLYHTDTLVGLMAEVTNTYKESYLYQCDKRHQIGPNQFKIEKPFHVSPFLNETGHYHFTIANTASRLLVTIDYYQANQKVLTATFGGTPQPLSRYQLLKTAITHPLTNALVLPRIFKHAIILYYKKKLHANVKPIGQNLIRTMPLSLSHRRIWSILSNRLKQLKHGCLTLTLPDGSQEEFGDPASSLQAQITINNTWFFSTLARKGEIGFAQAYIRGYWHSSSVANLLKVILINCSLIQSMGNGSWWYRLYLKFATRKQALNTVDQSKSNIQDHYDISNDFYALFLDETKLYSSALFDNESESLSTAQQRKLRALVEPMNLSPTDHVLEIGSGWGGMALYIAKTVGCRVTTITLSQEQYNWTQQRIHDEGLQDLISIQLQDYRTLSGHYDHIVSIEMIEAVGHQFLPDYFKQLNRLVKPGGRVILQAITYPNHDYKRYKTSMDFIKHSIFPGGHLPSLETITSLTRQLTHLRLVTATNIASSYAITLKKWAENLQGNEAAAQKLGFSSDFLRRWHYYFAYCEAAFSSDYLGVYQLQFKRNAV